MHVLQAAPGQHATQGTPSDISATSASPTSSATPDAFARLRALGADLNILTYAFNFKRDGMLNQDLTRANELNRCIYARLGLRADGSEIYGCRVIVSTTDFYASSYGSMFFGDYVQRLLGLGDQSYSGEEDAVTVMRSVIMDPWMAEDIEGRPFLDTFIAELRAVVIEEVEAYRATLAD